LEIVVYKWLLLVTGETIDAIGYSGRSGTTMHQIEFSRIAYQVG